MKKTTFALILLIFVPALLINAQGRRGWDPATQEKFRSMKIAFFTDELEFTTEEAEKFWPVYHKYEEKQSDLHRERRNSFRGSMEEFETISDEQAEEMIKKHLEFQKKDLQLEIELYTNIKEILPPKKIAKLHITEMRFREHMLKQLRGERGGQGGPGSRRPEKNP